MNIPKSSLKYSLGEVNFSSISSSKNESGSNAGSVEDSERQQRLHPCLVHAVDSFIKT